ncbi:MAG: hypothetical protein B0D91_14575 [Oceanospirillales bacterium LUC14_002_19_P2]|nr:MAG: hypothetical protein B0D91_14575 [Oceanospirillales bacterium LUC14_002_19_P2]
MDLNDIQPMLEWLRSHHEWLAVSIMLIALVESLAIAGIVLPGVVMLFGAATIAGSGVLDVWTTLIAAFIGAVLGDGISFILGRVFHQHIANWWPFTKHPQWLEEGEQFFHRHGGKSIAFGRFIGPVRPIIPLVAGMLDMPATRFYVVNIISAIAWAPVYILPGYLVGASMQVSPPVSEDVLVILAMLFGTSLFFAFMSGYIHDKIQSPDKPSMPSGRLFISGRYLMLTSGISLILITCLVVVGELKFVNAAITQWLVFNHTGLMNQIMVAITLIGNHEVHLVWFGLAAIWLGINRQWKLVLTLCILITGVESVLWLMKWGLDLHRPDNPAELVRFSFPSGHTTLTTFLSLWFARYIALAIPEVKRPWIWSVGIVIAMLVGFSRLYLSVHWTTDVLGGVALGTLGFSIWLITCGRFSDTQPPQHPVILLATLLISSTVIIALMFPAARATYLG